MQKVAVPFAAVLMIGWIIAVTLINAAAH